MANHLSFGPSRPLAPKMAVHSLLLRPTDPFQLPSSLTSAMPSIEQTVMDSLDLRAAKKRSGAPRL
eukprot:2147228-Amphidinium_carterae.1